MARSLTTTDHETIRNWAEQRGGKPAQVASTAQGDDVGIIRIDLPGFGSEGKLEGITWDDWFQKFDGSNLAFVYEEETADGQRSSFNELVGREAAEPRAQGVKTSRRGLRSSAGKGTKAKGSRQVARAEVARTARSGRSGRSAPAATRGSASTRKSAAGRKRATSTGRSSSSRSGGTARKSAAKGRSARKSK